jgi:hypothetical protein
MNVLNDYAISSILQLLGLDMPDLLHSAYSVLGRTLILASLLALSAAL